MKRPETEMKPFNLLRYFTVASLGLTLLVAVGAWVLLSGKEKEDLVAGTERSAKIIAKALTYAVEDAAPEILKEGVSPVSLGPLAKEVQELAAGFGVQQVSIINPRGKVIFSTRTEEIGELYLEESPFYEARKGMAVSSLVPPPEGRETGATLVTFAPLRASSGTTRKEGPVLGVYRMVKDGDPVAAQLSGVQGFAAEASLLGMGLLFCSLFLIVAKADRIIRDRTRRVRVVNMELQEANRQLVGTIAQLQATQSQLIQSDKLAAIGQLTSGIVHELSNPLVGVIGQARSLLSHVEDEHPLRKDLQFIVKASKRCREISDGLLSFARRDRTEMGDVDLNEVIQEALGIFRWQAKVDRIEVKPFLTPRLPRVRCSRNQIQQVILNILMNAGNATEGGGEIRVGSKPSNGFVEITVKDDGVGMPPEVQSQIFEPFFTTKGKGKGTGLGLPICQSIIEKLGGEIRVTSQEGMGTEVIVSLPLEQPAGSGEVASPATAAAN